jgi:c-di-GMP phosphodiesterase
MLDVFRKWLGHDQVSDKTAETTQSFDRLQAVAPLKGEAPAIPISSDNPAARTAQAFISREVLLDRQERITGYRFSLPESIQSRLAGKLDRVQKVHDDALLHHFASLDIGSLLGQRLAVVGMAPASLGNPLVQKLPEGGILMLTPTDQTFVSGNLNTQLEELRSCGYSHGWLVRQAQLVAHPELLALAANADYAQIEVKAFDGMDIKNVLKALRAARAPGLPPLRLIASELDTFDEFHLCFQGGFDIFQGRFVNSRENWHPPKSDINRALVMEILKLVRSGADYSLIAEQLKREPVLAFKLLRYINSAAMGLQTRVDTMSKALLLLGHEKFYRWLSLLLFDIKTPGYRERLLTEQALTRGRCLETLAGQGRLPKEKDHLFLLGMFSLLDVLMGLSVEEMLKQAKLPEPVQAALLRQPGPYLDALQLAIAAEGHDQAELKRCAELCGITPANLSYGAIEGLAWASAITALGEASAA